MAVDDWFAEMLENASDSVMYELRSEIIEDIELAQDILRKDYVELDMLEDAMKARGLEIG